VSNILSLARHKAYLLSIKTARHQQLKQLAVNIQYLWNRLQTPQSERDTFLSQHSGLTLQTIAACEAELERLKQKRTAYLHETASTTREKLVQLWNETFVPIEQRQQFKPFCGEWNEELLESMEHELVKMANRSQMMQPILTLMKQRNDLKQEMDNYQRAEKDPNRFKISGRLLQEEKFRKKFNKIFPKINQQLIQQIGKWEKENGMLMVDGKHYLQQLQAQQTPHKNDNQPKPARSTKPSQTSTKQPKTHNKSTPIPTTPRTPSTPIALGVSTHGHSTLQSKERLQNKPDVPRGRKTCDKNL